MPDHLRQQARSCELPLAASVSSASSLQVPGCSFRAAIENLIIYRGESQQFAVLANVTGLQDIAECRLIGASVRALLGPACRNR